MKTFRFLILSALLFCVSFVFGQSAGDYRSVTTGNWTTLATWQRYDGTSWIVPTTIQGYPGQYNSQSYGVVTIVASHNVTADFPVATIVTADGLGSISGRTTNNVIQKLIIKAGTAFGNGAILTLPVSGNVLATLVKTQDVEIENYGALNFGAKATFAIPADAVLKVGQSAFIGSVSANNNIVVGNQWFAVGTSNKAQFNFSELIAAGGTLNSNMTSPAISSVYCQNESIPLSGNFSGVSGTTTAGGTIAGVNYFWYLDENYTTAIRTGVLTTANVDHAVFNYPAASLTPGVHTLRFYNSTYYTTTLYSNNENRTVTILETPKLSSVSQPWAACRHNATEIQLNGMIPNTTFTVNYTITGNSQATTTATSDATGKAVFNLTIGLVDHGKTLTVNSLSYTSLGKTCTQTLSANNTTTLSVWRFDGFTWTGRVSNDWHNAANWCRGTFNETFTIPTAETNVYIPDKDSTQFSPVISSNDAVVKDITIGNDGVLSFEGESRTLELKGNWTNRGTFNRHIGKVLLNGTSQQKIEGTIETAFYQLEINNNSGVIAETNLSVWKLLTLTSPNVKTSEALPTADRGTLHTGNNILTMADTAYTQGGYDVTGIVRRVNIQFPNRQYTFGSRYTLMTFAASGTYPSEIKAYISIGAAPAWKTNAILREYHFIQTGGENCYATIRTSYKDTELNGLSESRLVQWTQFSTDGVPEGGYEWGRSNASSTDNWVEITNINIGLFPTEKGSTGNSLGANVTETLVWNGSVSTDWADPVNWTPNTTPTEFINVIIPDASTTNFDPLIKYFPAPKVKSILLEENSILNSADLYYEAAIDDFVYGRLIIFGSQGAWINQGGTFNPNGGTVRMVYTEDNPIATVSGTTQFHNISLDANLDLFVTANSHIKISGAVTLNGTGASRATIGSISGAANTIEYNGTATTQTIVVPNEASPRYYNLILSGSGDKYFPSVDMNIFGNFTVSDAVTVNLPANSLNVYGNIAVNEGTNFAAGTSTVNMAGISGQSIGGTKTSLSLYNLTNSNTADTVKVNIPSLSLGGNLTNSGVLDFGTNLLTGVTGTIANSGTIRTANTTATPLPVNKTWSAVSGENTSGTVEYSGVAAQTAVAGTYHNLTVANPIGLTAAGNITMTGNLALNTNASDTKGSLDMGAHTLEMGLTGTTTGAGDVSGIVKRTGAFVNNVAYSFGNEKTFVKFLGVPDATKPAWLGVRISIGTSPTLAGVTLADYYPVSRTYSFAQAVGGTDRTIVQLRYLESELNENTIETNLAYWDSYDDGTSNVSYTRGHNVINSDENWVILTGIASNFIAIDDEYGTKEWTLANNKSTIKWTGNGSPSYVGDWSLPGNWDGGVPMADDDVVFSAIDLPVDFRGWPSRNLLSDSVPAVAKSITIENNARLNGSGYSITLYGSGNTWINHGTFKGDTLAIPSALSKVVFANGSATPAVITGDSISAFHHLEIAENSSIQLESDTMLIAGNVTSGSGSVVDFNTNKTTVIYNGSKQTVINPTGGSGGYHNLILAGSGTKTLAADSPLQVKGNFTMSGTASTTPVQPLLVDTAFTIDAGATFNGGSRTHFVGGDFVTNGTFNAQSSTINFNGAADQHISTVNEGPVVFNNMYIPVVSEGKKLIPDTDIQINGSLVNQAILNMGLNDLSGTLSLINNNGTIETQSTSIAALPSSKIWEGTGYVLFNGLNEQTLVNGTFNNIEIANAAGLVQSGNVRINSDLKLTNGLLTTSSSDKLTINCAASITGASDTSFINGPLLREYCAADSLHFPIGKTGAYRPLSIKYTLLDAPSVVTAEQFEVLLPGATDSGLGFGFAIGTTDIIDTRYWKISQTGATDFNYDITLDSTDFVLTAPYDKSAIVKGIEGAYSTYTAKKYGSAFNISSQNSFSNFTLGRTECAAPEITLHPVDGAAVAGKESASFSVTATGSGKLSYQWQQKTGSGFVNITDATSNTLTIDPVTASMHNNIYRVVVTDGGCVNTAISNEAKLSVSVLWVGGTTDWGNTDNWYAGALPASGADIVFATVENNEGVAAQNNLILDADRVIGSLQNESDKAIVIPTGVELLVNDTLPAGDLASKIHIKSAAGVANGSLRFAKPSKNTNVNATVEMYSKAEATVKLPAPSSYRWQFFGIPLKSMQKADPVFYGSWVSRFVESASGTYWVSLNNNSPLFSWQGYEVTHADPKTIVFSGSLETANFEKSLNYTEGATYKGQHIFGNPYTTAIDISKIDFGTETEATVYLYNTGSRDDWTTGGRGVGGNAGQYVAIPKNLSSATTPAAGIEREIPSMQGFLVRKKNNDANNLVNFTITINYDSVAKKNLSPQRAPKQNDGLAYTIVDVKGSRYSDRVWLFTNPECSNDFDNGWDGQKYPGSSVSPLLYTRYSTRNYQVQTTNDINGTDLRFRKGEDSQYQFSFTHYKTNEHYSGGIFLEDLLTGIRTDISASGSVYSFSAASTDPAARFRIVTEPAIGTDNKELSNTGAVSAYSYNKMVVVNNFSSEKLTFVLYDAVGRALYENKIMPQNRSQFNPGLPEGAYVVRFSNGETFKLIFE